MLAFSGREIVLPALQDMMALPQQCLFDRVTVDVVSMMFVTKCLLRVAGVDQKSDVMALVSLTDLFPESGEDTTVYFRVDAVGIAGIAGAFSPTHNLREHNKRAPPLKKKKKCDLPSDM